MKRILLLVPLFALFAGCAQTEYYKAISDMAAAEKAREERLERQAERADEAMAKLAGSTSERNQTAALEYFRNRSTLVTIEKLVVGKQPSAFAQIRPPLDARDAFEYGFKAIGLTLDWRKHSREYDSRDLAGQRNYELSLNRDNMLNRIVDKSIDSQATSFDRFADFVEETARQ